MEKIEKELEKFATRSIQATKNINKGDKLVFEKNFELLRPGKRTRGADAIDIQKINGKISKRKIQTCDGIKTNYVI